MAVLYIFLYLTVLCSGNRWATEPLKKTFMESDTVRGVFDELRDLVRADLVRQYTVVIRGEGSHDGCKGIEGKKEST